MRSLFMRRPDLDLLPDKPALPAGMTLRTIEQHDIDGTAKLLRTAFHDEIWTASFVRQTLIDAVDVRQTYVIVFEDDIVATASVRIIPETYPCSGYVHWVAASSNHRGQKLGFIVSLAVLREFVRLGCKDAVLETDDNRVPAIKTYLQLGFLPMLRDEGDVDRWREINSKILQGGIPPK